MQHNQQPNLPMAFASYDPITRLENMFSLIRYIPNERTMLKAIFIRLKDCPDDLSNQLANDWNGILAVLLAKLYDRYRANYKIESTTIRFVVRFYICLVEYHSDGEDYEIFEHRGMIARPSNFSKGAAAMVMRDVQQNYGAVYTVQMHDTLLKIVEPDVNQWRDLFSRSRIQPHRYTQPHKNTPLSIAKHQVHLLYVGNKDWARSRLRPYIRRFPASYVFSTLSDLLSLAAHASSLADDEDRDDTKPLKGHVLRKGSSEGVIVHLFAVIPTASKHSGWTQGETVIIYFPSGRCDCPAVILKSTLINGGGLALHLDATNSLQCVKDEKLGNIKVDVRFRLKKPEDCVVDTMLKNFKFDRKIPQGSNAYKILHNLYVGSTWDNSPLSTEGSPTEAVVETPSETKVLSLDHAQRMVIGSSLSKMPFLSVRAAYGSGKTVTMGIAALQIIKEKDALVLMLAETNAAVKNFADTLYTLVGNRETIFHHLSSAASADYSSYYDVQYLISKMDIASLADDRHGKIIEQYQNAQQFLNSMSLDELSESDKEIQGHFLLCKEILADRDFSVQNILYNKKPPRIICVTIGHLLSMMMEGKASLCQYIFQMMDNITVITDESSQISEPTLLCLLSRLPHARYRMIGDPRQLPPHSMLSRGSFAGAAAATGICNLIELRNSVINTTIPEVLLSGIYRSHPSITRMLSTLFYDNTLTIKTTEADRCCISRVVTFPSPGVATAVIDIDGIEKKIGRSYVNYKETDAALDIVEWLLFQNIKPRDILILSYYTAQAEDLEIRLRQVGVRIENIGNKTVESAQGLEAQAVIVCTTRVDPDKDTSFVDERRRMNVALSRAKSGLFVLGKTEQFKRRSNHNALLAWLTDNNVPIVHSLEDLLVVPPQPDPQP